jgi:hypothetical protein
MRRGDSMRVRRVLTVAAASALAVAAIGITIGNNTRARADAGCSAETIRGAYALYATGIAFGAPWAAIGRSTFDGAGNSTSTMIETYDGVIDDGTLDGTYTLNPDCRGSMTYTMKHYARGTSQAGQAHEYRHEVHTIDIVVAAGGQKIYAVVVDTYPKAAPPGVPQTDDPSFSINGWLERM